MCACDTLYAIEAAKGDQLLPSGGWAGDGEWRPGENRRFYCTVEQAQKELKEIPREIWPDGTTSLTIIEYHGPDAR